MTTKKNGDRVVALPGSPDHAFGLNVKWNCSSGPGKSSGRIQAVAMRETVQRHDGKISVRSDSSLDVSDIKSHSKNELLPSGFSGERNDSW